MLLETIITSAQFKKSVRNRPRFVQPLASHYADLAILAHSQMGLRGENKNHTSIRSILLLF